MVQARAPKRHGRIVYTWIADRNGYSKIRPAIILTPDDEISRAQVVTVMAVTTTFPNPVPTNCVPIPWHPRTHPVTGLHQRSAAVVDWLAPIDHGDIVGYGGDVPPKTLHQIYEKLRGMRGSA